MRLLVVEDEKSLRDDITKKLRLDGYEADACGDGNEARELLAVERYDLVLLDINLPDIDGYEVARRLRASAKRELTSVPIIAITANALKGDAEKALQYRAEVEREYAAAVGMIECL